MPRSVYVKANRLVETCEKIIYEFYIVFYIFLSLNMNRILIYTSLKHCLFIMFQMVKRSVDIIFNDV